jgi:putative ubiquitin-RnfH superfamily antitoxin RatB of RatAB toxin-antitoxin module
MARIINIKIFEMDQFVEKRKSVKSRNPWKSVIQTSYNIVKVYGAEIKLEKSAHAGNELEIYQPL